MSDTKCRLCLKCYKRDDFSYSVADDQFRQMIENVFPFWDTELQAVSSQSCKLPDLVCLQCTSKVKDFFTFSGLVKANQKKLRAEYLLQEADSEIDDLINMTEGIDLNDSNQPAPELNGSQQTFAVGDEGNNQSCANETMQFLDQTNDHTQENNQDHSLNSRRLALSVYYQNVGGLLTKKDKLKNAMTDCEFDIIVFTKTRLDRNTSSSSFSDGSYMIFRCDSCGDGRGGGVLIACRPNLRPVEIDPCNSSIEQVWVKLNWTKPAIVLGAINLPSTVAKNKTTIEALSKSIQGIVHHQRKDDLIFVLGDFNQSRISWDGPKTFLCNESGTNFNYYEPIPRPADTLHFVNAVKVNGLFQLSSISKGNGRQRDLVFGNEPAANACSQIQESENPLLDKDLKPLALKMSISDVFRSSLNRSTST